MSHSWVLEFLEVMSEAMKPVVGGESLITHQLWLDDLMGISWLLLN